MDASNWNWIGSAEVPDQQRLARAVANQQERAAVVASKINGSARWRATPMRHLPVAGKAPDRDEAVGVAVSVEFQSIIDIPVHYIRLRDRQSPLLPKIG